jgi:hypothetical protein
VHNYYRVNHNVNNYCNKYCPVNFGRIRCRNAKKEIAMGRPPVPSHLKRDKRLVVMLTDQEMETLAAAAKTAGAASVSDWVRDALLAAAKG